MTTPNPEAKEARVNIVGEGKGWKVICGDCREVMPTLGSVDAVVTDPPYGMAYQSAWRTDKDSRFAPIANDDRLGILVGAEIDAAERADATNVPAEKFLWMEPMRFDWLAHYLEHGRSRAPRF